MDRESHCSAVTLLLRAPVSAEGKAYFVFEVGEDGSVDLACQGRIRPLQNSPKNTTAVTRNPESLRVQHSILEISQALCHLLP